MTRIENYHFGLNRILLLAVGLWPYEQSKFSRFQFIFFSATLMSIIVVQFTVLLTSKCTLDLVLEIFSTALLFSICLIKYILFGFDIESIKEFLTEFQHIYDQLKDKNEIAITDKYGYNAKRFTAILIMFCIACVCIYLIMEFWPDVLDIILQLNISQPHQLPILTEYFIDQKKYFYLIMIHMGGGVCIASTVMLAIGTMLIAFFHHSCGIFRIASYRIEHSITFKVIQNSIKNETLIFEKIISAVNIHRQAMKLSICIISRFEIMYFCLIICGVITLSFNLFRICQIISVKANFIETMLPIFITTLIISYNFIGNYLGQDLADHCKDVFLNAYNIQWYITPLRVQRLILFLLQRGMKDFNVNVGGLFIASFEGFAMLVKTSVSYFTVIYSTR